MIPKLASTYDGTTQIVDPAPALAPPKPVTVAFTKTGTYKYFCDIHTGMVGYVVARRPARASLSAKQDRKALKAQEKAVELTAKRVFKTKVPKNTIDLGQAGPGGVEDFGMFPNRVVVSSWDHGQVLDDPKNSREPHTATFGPTKLHRGDLAVDRQSGSRSEGVVSD